MYTITIIRLFLTSFSDFLLLLVRPAHQYPITLFRGYALLQTGTIFSRIVSRVFNGEAIWHVFTEHNRTIWFLLLGNSKFVLYFFLLLEVGTLLWTVTGHRSQLHGQATQLATNPPRTFEDPRIKGHDVIEIATGVLERLVRQVIPLILTEIETKICHTRVRPLLQLLVRGYDVAVRAHNRPLNSE